MVQAQRIIPTYNAPLVIPSSLEGRIEGERALWLPAEPLRTEFPPGHVERIDDALNAPHYGIKACLDPDQLLSGLDYHAADHSLNIVIPAAMEMSAYAVMMRQLSWDQATVFVIAAGMHDTGFHKALNRYDENERVGAHFLRRYMEQSKFRYKERDILSGERLILVTNPNEKAKEEDEFMIKDCDLVYVGFEKSGPFIQETHRLFNELNHFPQSALSKKIEKSTQLIKGSKKYFDRFRNGVSQDPYFNDLIRTLAWERISHHFLENVHKFKSKYALDFQLNTHKTMNLIVCGNRIAAIEHELAEKYFR